MAVGEADLFSEEKHLGTKRLGLRTTRPGFLLEEPGPVTFDSAGCFRPF